MRIRHLLAVPLAAALLAACGGYEPTAVPEPPEPAASSASPAAEAPRCADPLRSYAPTGPLPAASAIPADSTMGEIRQRGQLIAGVSADTLLMGARNPLTGRIEGFDIDLVKQVAKALFGDENSYQLRVITAADRIPLLEAGEVDIVVRNFTINCERWEQIAFSAVYYTSGQQLLVRRDQAARVDGPEDLGGVRVCAPTGSTSLANIRAKAPDAVVVEAANHTGCLVKFQEGDVDAITGDDTVLAGLAAQDPYAVVVGERFSEEPYGIGVNADDVDLVRFVNAVLERMRVDGAWEASYRTWLQPTLGRSPGQPQPRYGREP